MYPFLKAGNDPPFFMPKTNARPLGIACPSTFSLIYVEKDGHTRLKKKVECGNFNNVHGSIFMGVGVAWCPELTWINRAGIDGDVAAFLWLQGHVGIDKGVAWPKATNLASDAACFSFALRLAVASLFMSLSWACPLIISNRIFLENFLFIQEIHSVVKWWYNRRKPQQGCLTGIIYRGLGKVPFSLLLISSVYPFSRT